MIFSRFKWNRSTVLELSAPTSAFIHYRSHRMNLLTGFPEQVEIGDFQSRLGRIDLKDKFKKPTIFHFYYDYGLLEMGQTVSQDAPLAIEIEYKKSKKTPPAKPRLGGLPVLTLERPGWSEYKESFSRIQQELLDGNCYQVNLTCPFDFYTEDMLDPRDIADFFFSRRGTGAYAHCTYFGEGMILSNSPECLFQYQDDQIFTMPIKGTVKCEKHEVKKKWADLMADRKEEGELLMITDLLKNDLNKLSDHKAKVIRLRAPLIVPGLLHQYSLISAEINKPISLLETMSCLFPGGSITGAPKKRVMEIISDVERFQRGIYCGSTVLCYGDKKVASINIRTAFINPEERMWRYGAGGGITLLSKASHEYREMEGKVESFLTLLKSRSSSVGRQ